MSLGHACDEGAHLSNEKSAFTLVPSAPCYCTMLTQDRDNPLSYFWPASVHVIGKDITWFHCVIWPCILKSAGLPLPQAVFAHGFVAAADGRKMSKSLGNVVDPHDICDQ